MVFYYVVLAGFFLMFYLARLLVKSRFGFVLKGIKQNEEKMISLGYPVFHYKLVSFVIAGGVAGLPEHSWPIMHYISVLPIFTGQEAEISLLW